jgi:hypothetical protein
MEVFWNTIASYNVATWPLQIVWVLVATVLLLLLYWRPSRYVRIAMKLYMVAMNFWIAGVYYLVYCEPRAHHDAFALFWAIMGGMWLYDLLVSHASLERTGNHSYFALVLFVLPLLYPVASLLLGRSFPVMTMPVMPCSVAIFTVGLMLAFSERVNMVLAMFLCHLALISLSKVYFFGIFEDYLLAGSAIPAMYIFFREYIQSKQGMPCKPSLRLLNGLLVMLCLATGVIFCITLVRLCTTMKY